MLLACKDPRWIHVYSQCLVVMKVHLLLQLPEKGPGGVQELATKLTKSAPSEGMTLAWVDVHTKASVCGDQLQPDMVLVLAG